MEKTMRWWSECTANWRDKWSKVRAERNKYKDDLKRLSIKHEATLQDLNKLHQTEAGSHKVIQKKESDTKKKTDSRFF